MSTRSKNNTITSIIVLALLVLLGLACDESNGQTCTSSPATTSALMSSDIAITTSATTSTALAASVCLDSSGTVVLPMSGCLVSSAKWSRFDIGAEVGSEHYEGQRLWLWVMALALVILAITRTVRSRIASRIAVVLCLLCIGFQSQAQTRAAAAVTVTSNANLGDGQAAIGGLGTVESRKDRFGFAATGIFGQLRKNQGGSGTLYGIAGEGRVFVHKNIFVSGGLSQSGYAVKSFSKLATAITGGVGISRAAFTLSGQYGRDVAGVTRRSLITGRAQLYATKRVVGIRPFFDFQAGVVRFNQHGSQTGAVLRAGFGLWFGGAVR